MYYDRITKKVCDIYRNYELSDPMELCEAMGIRLRPRHSGLTERSIKGFFCIQHRIKSITYNCDLPENLQRLIVSHELGHAMLHCIEAIQTFHDIDIFDDDHNTLRCEREANLFAAEYLLDDDCVLSELRDKRDFYKAASCLYVPPALLELKMRMLQDKGVKVPNPPILSHSTFLADLQIPESDTYD